MIVKITVYLWTSAIQAKTAVYIVNGTKLQLARLRD